MKRLGDFCKTTLIGGLLIVLPVSVVTPWKNLSRRAAGDTEGTALTPILFETDEGLVPAFIVEEHADRSCTIFVPAAPTPAVGAIYIVPPQRVHRLAVPVRQVVQCVTKWGVGCGELLTAKPSGDTDSDTSAAEVQPP